MFSFMKNFGFRKDSTSNAVVLDEIEHLAMDQSGDLGSLYDTSTNTITGKLSLCSKPKILDLNRPMVCQVIKGCTPESENLLEMIGMQQSLRMSILLKMVQPTGVALVIDHPKPIDRYTRFLHYCYETQLDSCDDDWFDKIRPGKKSNLATSKTCVLTQIVRGIHAVIVLQLPSNEENRIDRLLNKTCRTLMESNRYLDLTSEKRELMNQIISTTTYSNITLLTKKTNLESICQQIQDVKDQLKKHARISYVFTRIPHQDRTDYANDDENIQLEQCMGVCFEIQFLRQFSQLKVLHFRLHYELTELLQGKLSERLFAAQQSFKEIKKLYEGEMQKVSRLVARVRKNQAGLTDIECMIKSDVQITILECIDQLFVSLDNLTSKAKLIRQLQDDGFEYCNLKEVGITQDTSEETVREILFMNNPKKKVFCATDELKEKYPGQWESLYFAMRKEAQEQSQWTFIYADFTYSKWRLSEMINLVSSDQKLCGQPSAKKDTISRQLSKPPSPQVKEVDDCINILLLGESGVGKSTFINAFANYLHFNSLETAKTGQPIVVIPVSFLMTTGQDFEEHLIKLGDVDPNENHNSMGQSVTQQCRSYVFNVAPRKKLRIIDTPGFADTRGDSQDQINMDTVFSFVSNLTHLNAVCLLLKPNVARLNPFLYSCFTQIFQWFGEEIRNHLIFCFTNARSTFFAPGDTGPLLRSFLKTFPIKQIPFEKRNTFCFDSESFRYLVALQNDLRFDQLEEDEFVRSWTRSVDESHRLRTFFCEELHPYRRNMEWQSEKDLHYQINSLIRPILEGIRNIQRNIILHKTTSSLRLNVLNVDQAMIIDYTLNRSIEKYGDFWIFSDYLRPFSNTCASHEFSLTEYRLHYVFFPNQTEQSLESLKQDQTLLIEISTKLSRFLTKTLARTDDPFFSGLNRMVQEEQFISENRKSSVCNQQLIDGLKQCRHEYEQQINKACGSTSDQSLSNIYDLILSIDRIPMVSKQMDAIKAYQQHCLSPNQTSAKGRIESF